MKKDFYMPSSDGKTQLHGIIWKPERKIRGIFQLCHGMSEYIDRYDYFAEFLNSRGFLVLGHDHLGHGHSVTCKEHYGFFHETDGNKMLIRDIDNIMNTAKKQYPHLPYVMLGHSMGSFLLRQYLHTCSGKNISAAILVGSGQKSKFLIRLGILLSEYIAKRKGPMYRSLFLWKLSLGACNKKFQPSVTPVDWLTRDKKLCKKYTEDPLCNFIFTASAYRDLFKGMMTNYDKDNLKKIPEKLPIMIIGGSMDPIGDFGKGIPKIKKTLVNTGHSEIKTVLIPDGRHEILNEINKKEVFEIILDFAENHISFP